MKFKGLDRTSLKWIALVTMLIDHLGAVLGEEFYISLGVPWLYSVFRCVGRLSFPIFAFFIAEGWHYTRSKKRYFLTMLILAVISQPIYYFALNTNLFAFNIFFTFLVSLTVMFLIDKIRQNKSLAIFNGFLIFVILVLTICMTIIDIPVVYGIYGVLLSVIFYLFNHLNKKWAKSLMFSLSALLMILYWLVHILLAESIEFNSFVSLFALLSIPILMLYNGEKGKRSLKGLFYSFYPAHLLVLYLISLLII